MSGRMLALLVVAFLPLWLAAPAGAASPGDRFESPHVHPLELSLDGSLLFAVNTDDHRLSVFDLTRGPAPVLVAEIPVGIEPVSVRALGGRVWVVNHVSDSISLLDVAGLRVVRTLLVGDEPTDVVFAGSPSRAFVAVSQEDRVKVYDATNPGLPLANLLLSASDPRSLAVGLGGSKVYVTVLESGNRTTVVPEPVVTSTLHLPPPDPPMNPALPSPPHVGLIVKHDGTKWADEMGRSWNFALPYSVLDNDVIEIDAAGLTVTRAFSGVGTAIFNVAVNPATGLLVVSNQDAVNQVRFEPILRGRFIENRVNLVNPSTGAVTLGNLNAHIDRSNLSGTDAERALSLAFPLDVIVSADGLRIYVAAFSSAKVGVLDAGGTVLSRIGVGKGPSGLALDGSRSRLYVLNRIDNTISVVSLPGGTVTHTVGLGYDPVPANIREGQALFYDAANSSAHGDLTCGTCHLFGGMDNLGWDLGNPLGTFQDPAPGQTGSSGFHPMKGPMMTQSLKSLPNTLPLHWRGDRMLLDGFNPAFVSLLGRGAPLSYNDFNRFEDFVNALRYPPNPNRNLDGTLPNPGSGPNPTTGEQLFLTGNLVGALQCVSCHVLPTGDNGLIIPGIALGEDQDMEVPQLRNLYEKTRFDNQAATTLRGFGYAHDGAQDDLFTFLQFRAFTFRNDDDRRHVAAFLLAFDTGAHAAVGAQWTMDGANEAAGLSRLNTLLAAADAGSVGLYAKGRNGAGEDRGWTYEGQGDWTADRVADGTRSTAWLLQVAGPGTEITFTACLPGCETRLGVDRDEDGHRDRDEVDAGSDPANPASLPGTVAVAGPEPGPPSILAPVFPNPAGAAPARVRFTVGRRGPVRLVILDVQGRPVRTLLDRADHALGDFTLRWDLLDDTQREVSSGIYFVKLATLESTGTQRLIVLR